MKALLLSLLVVSSALAQDVPKVVVLSPGEAAPSQGLFLPEPVAIAKAKQLKDCEAKVDVYEAKQMSPVLVVVLIAAGVVVGAGAGAGIAIAASKP